MKLHPSVTSARAQMTHFETWSDFTDHFGILNQLLTFSGQTHDLRP